MRAASRFNSAVRRRAVAGIGCVLAVAGCYFGPSPRTYEPAWAVYGATTQIRTQRENRRPITTGGELLTVTDTSVLVRGARGTILAFPHARILRLQIPGQRIDVTGTQLDRSPRVRDAVRQFARFPYGIRPATLDTLLADAGQTVPLAPGDPGTLPGVDTQLRAVTRGPYEVSIRGELLAVEASALVVASDERGVVRVAYACLTHAKFDNVETPPGLGKRREPTEEGRAALARHARFPNGLGPSELERVLPAGSTGPSEIRCQ
jgi:hypothetical protein